MRKLFYFIFLTIPLCAEVKQNEIETLHELIEATKRNLNAQESLLRELVEFKRVRAAFIEESTSARLATKLVKSATAVYLGIKREHLEHLFSSDFLSELVFYTQIGTAQKINNENSVR